MIITNLLGGLGNQMFQYAAGRALSLARGQSLQLDISGFVNYGLHQGFELERVFVCPVNIATGAELRNILGWQRFSMIRRVLARPGLAAIRRTGFIIEPHFHFWPGIQSVPQDCYLAGYWQSDKYFKEAIQKIRSDFTFKTPLNQRNGELAEQICGLNAISLHVRRGDYLKNPKTKATHGLCTLEYYYSAIQYIVERVDRPNFFIFSDDISWARENLKIDFPCWYVENNKGVNSYQDMQLMSMCRHHIIANSSFSWWGAWLNPNDRKIVIAPSKWFAYKKNTKDILPEGWIQL
jgi:hypothetical protein